MGHYTEKEIVMNGKRIGFAVALIAAGLWLVCGGFSLWAMISLNIVLGLATILIGKDDQEVLVVTGGSWLIISTILILMLAFPPAK